MGFLDDIGGLLQQYAGGSNVNPDQARRDYDAIAGKVPPHVLGSVIGPALASLGRQEVQTRILNSATEMTPSVRGQFLQQLLAAAGRSGANITTMLSQLGVNPSVATTPEQASPDEVAKVAAHVHDTRPDLFNEAMHFYSEHPTLVKVLGTLAIAKIAQRLSTQTGQTTR
jgi:hypothetical protein